MAGKSIWDISGVVESGGDGRWNGVGECRVGFCWGWSIRLFVGVDVGKSGEITWVMGDRWWDWSRGWVGLSCECLVVICHLLFLSQCLKRLPSGSGDFHGFFLGFFYPH